MILMINGTVLTQWSRTRASRALRTAEAEHYAVVAATAEGLGVHSIMEDLGCTHRSEYGRVPMSRKQSHQGAASGRPTN